MSGFISFHQYYGRRDINDSDNILKFTNEARLSRWITYTTQLARLSLEDTMFSPPNKGNMSQKHQCKSKNYKPKKLGFTHLSHSYLGAPFLNILNTISFFYEGVKLQSKCNHFMWFFFFITY